MKTTFRKQALPFALALLAPLAATLVAAPAAAQHRAVVAPPQVVLIAPDARVAAAVPAIDRFVVRGDGGRLRPGRELRFHLRGAPGARAWVDIPGVIRGVALHEARPGVYEGSYTIRRRDALRAFDDARAFLQAGGQRTSARAGIGDRDDDRRADRRRDDSAPRISDVTPDEGGRISERGRAHIFARLSDDRSGVEPASVRLRIDGRDVTARTSITAEEVRYRENLAQGLHRAELVVSDRAGNTARKIWTFRIVDRDRRG